MKPHGLISDEWLVSYAAGSLPDAHALIVATHAHYHPEVQEKIQDAEHLGGSLIADITPSDISGDLLANTLAKLDDTFDIEEKEEITSTDTDIPHCLRSYLGENLDSLKWRMMGPGLKQVKLVTGPEGEKLWLLRAKGGTKIPEHDHNGLELTLVLRGAYKVGDQHYTPGLIECADKTLRDHQPTIDEGEDCICLVVTEAPIKLRGFIPRLVQPFIGL